MKPLLMMRTKGLTGPLLTGHFGVPGLSKAGKHHSVAFPEMSDAVIFEAFVEDGVRGTIIAVYNDDLEIVQPFNPLAFKVMVNGKVVGTNGISIDPFDFTHLEITFHPPAFKGDVITFQYDARVDPGFIDTIENKPINNVVNPVDNQVLTEPAAGEFGLGYGDGYT